MVVYILLGVGLIGLITVGIILSRLYVRASKTQAFVRTGLGGEKVIKDGGAVVLPILHETIHVNMGTLKIEIKNEMEGSLITKDKQLVDVSADFFVKVKPDKESIAKAAQTLGDKLKGRDELKEFVESKFIDALRSVASTMEMEQLHQQRTEFVQMVRQTVTSDLDENGLGLESVSLKSLNQTDLKFYKDTNVFNAEGLAKTTKIIQSKLEEKERVLRDTEVAIARKNMEAEKEQLDISRTKTYNQLEQDREIEVRRAEQEMQVKVEQAAKMKEAEEADIRALQDVEAARIASGEALAKRRQESEKTVNESMILTERATEKARIEKQKDLETAAVEKQKALETAALEKDKALELSQQELEQAKIERRKAVETAELHKDIEIAEKRKAESEARAEAENARKELIRAEQEVLTVSELATANREKEKQIIEAEKEAETRSIGIKVAAKAEKEAQLDRAEAATIEARAKAEKLAVESEAQRAAGLKEIEVMKSRYDAEAEGKKALHEADNALSDKQIELKVKLALIEQLPKIIEASVKPAEHINEIKLVQVSGVGAIGGGASGGEASVKDGNMFEQAKDAMLGYQAHKGLMGKLFKELGLSDDTLENLPAAIYDSTMKKPEDGRTGGDE